MPGLLRGVARTAVVAGTATAVSGRVSRRQQQRWAAQEPAPEPQYEQAPPAPAPASAAPGRDPAEQLRDLATLKEQGVLTDSEFVAQKARILGG
jgi:hypothetical protein